MSKCVHCLQRMCKKHPLQDHGERAASLQKKLMEQRVILNPQQILQAEIERLSGKSKGTLSDENETFRQALEADRAFAMKASDNQKGLKANSSFSGLNPSVSSLMMNNLDENDEGKSSSTRTHKKRKIDSDSDDSSSSDSSASSDRSKKRKKKSKKHKKEKKGKKEHKKHSRKRKSDKKRSDASSSSDSDD